MNKKIYDVLYIFLIVFFIFTSIYLYYFIKSESKQCLEQPFIYGAKETEGETYCSCYSITETGTLQFNFNESLFERRINNIPYE